ncbi:MAG: S41 family peptidase [Cyanobacteria bacterium REEB67]|nr:S41 family peptidase [Cyanobacteria bacterium REEB67]
MKTDVSAGSAARALYHEIWRTVSANFFAVERLADWPKWEHCFDEEIIDQASALACARRMLTSLKDSYTEIVEAASTTAVGELPGATAAAAAVEASPAAVTSFLTPSGIGYLRVLSFDHDSVAEEIAAAAAKIADCRGVLLDLRHNSGGRMHRAIEACGLFLENGLVATVDRRGEDVPVGVIRREYYLNDQQFFCVETSPSGPQPAEMYERRPALLAGKPLVILIGRRTASAAELFVAALVQNGIPGQVSLVGSDTAGKGIGQAIFELSGTTATLSITRSHWFAPGGDWLGDCGQTVREPISPDVVVANDSGPEGLKIASDLLKELIGAVV